MKIFDKLIERASRRALGDFVKDDNYRFLRQNYLFKNLSAEAILFIMSRLVERRYNHDELIFKQDNLGICLFIVKQGKVEIYIRYEDQDKIVYAEALTGELFGEMSMISTGYRTANAKAVENDTILLALSTFDIEVLNNQFPRDGLKVLKGITDTIAENLIKTTRNYRASRHEIKMLQDKLAKYERG